MCDMDFKSNKAWERHVKTDLHKERIAKFYEILDSGKGFSGSKIAKEIRDKIPKSKGFQFR
jgi:hypothetical protein